MLRPGPVREQPGHAVPTERVPAAASPLSPGSPTRSSERGGARRAGRGASTRPWSWSSTRPRTSARSATCRRSSHMGSRGQIPVTVLQSDQKGNRSGASRAWPPCGGRHQEPSGPAWTSPPDQGRRRPGRPPRRARPVGVRRRRQGERADLLAAADDPRSCRHPRHRAGHRTAARQRHPPVLLDLRPWTALPAPTAKTQRLFAPRRPSSTPPRAGAPRPPPARQRPPRRRRGRRRHDRRPRADHGRRRRRAAARNRCTPAPRTG